MRRSAEFKQLIDTLKIAVATLRDRGVPFVLGGSLAAWARGGPEPQNDLDLMLKPADADAALEALANAGMRVERPPEEWLYKAWRDEVMIDLIFKPAGIEVNDELLGRADTISVAAVATPVMALEDVMVTMLCAIDEHALDYSRLVAIARALREQIDWAQLEGRTAPSPFAQAFFALVRGLGVAPSHDGAHRGGPSRVRVLPGGS
jgi:predicted nucleotidyltransferase